MKNLNNTLVCRTLQLLFISYIIKEIICLEHKINLTIANCLVSLISGSNELMVITIGHLMSSLETRPSAKAYKISTRVESINVEASVEYSLVPIIDTCAMRGNKYFVVKIKIKIE